ncbi:phosphatidate cytidylyltransferase [Tannerella sp.]|uniref:phosphatidate cytidylyltransferase n=1 Tax=Tannerella sp. TaxID=2382127 RepID=UPI0026DD9EF3|nr:phosphatidate cytidylyltransferase [Tannerella sp.]MDO4703486.1 phosphatidate cytidylyltransferase [Tannerella sp.]
MKKLFVRTVTGIVYVAVIVLAMTLHPYTFLALFTLVVGLSLHEFQVLIRHSNGTETSASHYKKSFFRWLEIAGGIYLFAASFFYASGQASEIIYAPYLLFLIFVLIAGLYHKEENPVNRWATTFFLQFYGSGLFSMLNFVMFDPTDKAYYPYYGLFIFIFIWLNDTGAYLVGTTFGKRRMFPRVSPLKSWEGFAGGLVIAWMAALTLAYFYPAVNWYHWIAFATIIVIFGTWGDLVESLIKRTYGVKDSGTLLPGHGGILDRFDSMMLATPAIWVYLRFFIQN